MARPRFLGCNQIVDRRAENSREREDDPVSYEHIRCDLDGPFMIVTLNRPDKLNAYTGQMGAEIADAFERADSDDNVRAIIVTGAGRAFCAGADVSGGAASFDTSGSTAPACSPAPNPAAAASSRRSSTAESRRSRRSTDRRWRRHHHDLADGHQDRGQRRQDRLHLCPPRPRSGSRQRLVLPKLVGLPQALRWCLSGRTFDADEAGKADLSARSSNPRSY